ncbi:MAG: DUF805 domain-containing protein [Ginsengibacter sp.]
MKWYFMVLKKYADFNGRARRSEYWYFVLFNYLVQLLIGYIGLYTFENPYFGTIYFVGAFIPYIAVGVRRMHDVDKSGWYILIPIYNLILCCTDGTIGPNDYGPDPKRPEILDDIELVGSEMQA